MVKESLTSNDVLLIPTKSPIFSVAPGPTEILDIVAPIPYSGPEFTMNALPTFTLDVELMLMIEWPLKRTYFLSANNTLLVRQ